LNQSSWSHDISALTGVFSNNGEESRTAARRKAKEETGLELPQMQYLVTDMIENFIIDQKSEKTIHIHATSNKKNRFTIILTYVVRIFKIFFCKVCNVIFKTFTTLLKILKLSLFFNINR